MKKFNNELFDFSKLQTTLVNSKMQQENNPLYQTINQLIKGAIGLSKESANSIKKNDLIDLTSQVDGMLPPNNGGIVNGSYFPNIINLANVANSNVFYTLFSIGARQVRVDGKLNIQPTAGAVLTQLELEMPVHSAFASADQLQGLINGIPLGGATEGFAGIIIGNVSNGGARIQFFPQNADNHDCRFSINYELV
jgi:hypothetical protein